MLKIHNNKVVRDSNNSKTDEVVKNLSKFKKSINIIFKVHLYIETIRKIYVFNL